MRNLGIIARRALHKARRFTVSLAPASRWPLAVGMAASLLVSALGPAAPVHAIPQDPSARIQFVIKSLYIYDDGDLFGNGELRFDTTLCTSFDPGQCAAYGPRAHILDAISAGTGDTVTLNRELPGAGDDLSGGADIEDGFAVYSGQQYLFHANMTDLDNALSQDDDLGYINIPIDEAHGWGIGASSIRSTHPDGSAGDYVLFYEIRRVPLANLQMVGYQVAGVSSAENVCGLIQNVGPKPAGPFHLTLRTEGQVVGSGSVDGLAAGASTWSCSPRADLPAHKLNLVFEIDDLRQVQEMEELDNIGVMTVEAIPGAAGAAGAAGPTQPAPAGPVAVPSPEPKPAGSQPAPGKDQADLTVRTIKVNGQAPDGKDDCKIGNNTVTVVVTNAGKGDAGTFAVRLTVDGANRQETADSLAAGQEQEIRFDGVQLKKGEHTLQAVADAGNAVAEAKDGNNELKVTATCNRI